jgi:hypothetical protein
MNVIDVLSNEIVTMPIMYLKHKKCCTLKVMKKSLQGLGMLFKSGFLIF